MTSFPTLSNEESWIRVLEYFSEYPDEPYWNEWRLVITPLVDQAVQAGYGKLFRAGMSMHHILISTLDHNGLRGEPHVTLRVTEDRKIQIHYSTANMSFGHAIQSQIIVPTEAFAVLTRYLQHLWTETVAEPIPEALRARIPKEIS